MTSRRMTPADGVRSRPARGEHPHTKDAQLHIFPLSFLLYCAVCDREVREQGNPKSRSRITGHTKNGLLGYRRIHGYRCRSTRASIVAEMIEADFAQLIKVMNAYPDSVALIAELAVHLICVWTRNFVSIPLRSGARYKP